MKRHSSGAGERVRENRHHRHWQKALKAVSGQKLATLPISLPGIGTILGGTFELNGNNISLACFAGVNFRSKSWGVFSLRHPHISFATEAQDILDENSQPATHIVQNFSLGLGRKAQQEGYAMDLLYAQHRSMATVCRISRSVMFAPQYRTVHEWFNYAFGASDLDEVYRFPLVTEQLGSGFGTSSSPTPGSSGLSFGMPSMSPNLSASSTSGIWSSGGVSSSPNARDTSTVDGLGSNVVSGMANVVSGVAASFGASLQSDSNQATNQRRPGVAIKSSAPANNKEIIFALPSLQMELKTEHVQPAVPPNQDSPMARVDCAFVTDFDDHIFVAVDVEAYFFLHDLISSYIKEKETSNAPSSSKGSQSPLISDKNRKNKPPPAASTSAVASSSSSNKLGGKERDALEQGETDWRDFVCQTWHLEPTVRCVFVYFRLIDFRLISFFNLKLFLFFFFNLFRLLSWAGKNIEPYGVDYILQRLGFTQARVTIPKWIQRGAMDPFDKVLAELLYQIVIANNGTQQKITKQ